MRILGIESSAVTASVAIITDDVLTAEYTINYKKTHSQTLLPMIDEICKMTETPLDTVDAIAISSGPGSFTGLRIGSSTGKGIGLALNKPVLAVPTLEAMAYNYYGSDCIICPLMDAKRSHVYAGIYIFEKNDDNTYEMKKEMEQSILSAADLVSKVYEVTKEYPEKKVIFLGDGTPVMERILGVEAGIEYTFAPVSLNTQRAASVAMLGMHMHENGMDINARDHAPDYLRPSQAERELNKKLTI